ncbi:hypothetical protein [Winogradskyella thalassocola]|uniref:Lipoprotein n=1 Tax=Winogradskyella thalassocola TaxID=262004 RepID=A0A1G8CUH8_9FLAO|nr:hypothetical protein [Winogradskyella thalassocola]SDH49145.1 hypothetical protein SAMN04489796_10352 [Winogradskyella thalassocola]
MKKSILITILSLTVFSSCNFKGPLSISNAEDLVEIQDIINENFDGESDVYFLTLSGSKLSSDISSINRKYDFKEITFSDVYFVSDNKFTDPKQTTTPFGTKALLKIKAIDVSIIPEKYNEALDILAQKKLLVADKSFPLSRWTFETDSEGHVCSNFTINYYINSTSQGRSKTTTYGSYRFKVDSNNTVTFIK